MEGRTNNGGERTVTVAVAAFVSPFNPVQRKAPVRPVRLLAEGEPPIPLDDRKTLHHHVDQAKAEQAARPRWKPAPDHP